jgi:pyruvate decarboxylase
MTPTIKLAEYLFQRLKQLEITSVHGVPGDFNLTLLDYVEPAGLTWVGNANELNAGYAADGYARIKGAGALITTFGVGELSAINAIAGAYSERAAVVHVVGTPPRAMQDGRAHIHHTFNDGEFGRFALMHEHVTVAQANLRDPRTAPEQIDEVLRQCLLHSRPVYISVPVDMVDTIVSSDRLSTNITLPEGIWGQAQDDALSRVVDRFQKAKKPVILVDGEIRALRIVDEVQELSAKTNWPTWTTTYAKGLLNESASNHHGIKKGNWDDEIVKSFWKDADLVLWLGPHASTTNSYGGSALPNLEKTISFTDTEIKIGAESYRDIPAKQALRKLLAELDKDMGKVECYKTYPTLPKDQVLSCFEADVNMHGKITQDKLWRILAGFLQPGDVVLGETGTPGYGCRDMVLPPDTRLFTPVTWLSIGYMLPAAQGAALAQRELIQDEKWAGGKEGRTILLIGDGSFQMTVQEIGTIIRLELPVIIFLFNNDGYTIERCIHGVRQGYNDVARWKYIQAPSFFGAKDGTYTAQARTWAELEYTLSDEELRGGMGVRMVEVFLDKEDAPDGALRDMMETQWKIEDAKKQ